MDFREEYKREVNAAMPDEQAMERIKRGVAERLAAPKRKPFPVRRMAVVCGSAAAGLIIVVSAAVILNSDIRPDNFIGMTIGADRAPGSQNMAGAPNKGGGNMNGGAPAGEFNDAPAPPEYCDGGAADALSDADAPSEANAPEDANAPEGSERTDNCLPDFIYSDNSAESFPDAMIELADNGVVLTINGTVTRFTKYIANEQQNANAEAWDSAPAAAEYDSDDSLDSRVPENGATVGVSEGSGTENAPGDSIAAGNFAGITAVGTETELIKVTADNGEPMFIKSDGNILWLYNIDYELLGVFIEIE